MRIGRPDDVPLGMPSPEAIRTATDATRRRYVLPETMHHPEVRFQCLWLAYLIQAYGLVTATPASRQKRTETPPATTSPRFGLPTSLRDVTAHSFTRSDRPRELVDA